MNKGEDKESIQSSTKPDPGRRIGKCQIKTNTIKHNNQRSPTPTGDHKAARIQHRSKAKTKSNNKNNPQNKHHCLQMMILD